MKYVSADALLKAVERYFTGALTASEREKILAGVPTIDIVFCKECKHWGKWSDEEMFCGCLEGGIGSDFDDFCSYGERKESE